MGVRKAVRRAEEVARCQDGAIYTLGPLIHNPQEVSRLSRQGIQVAGELGAVTEGTVVIRAHGAPPSVYKMAEDRGLKVVDATCPFVFSLQQRAVSLVNAGYQVIIIGDRSHPEVIGVVGWTEGRAVVVSSEEDVERLPEMDRVGVVAQTTQRMDKVQALLGKLREKAKEVCFENTICRATMERQEAARALAGRVQAMVVVGGRSSSNTQKLVSICRDAGAATFHVETAADLDPGWLQGLERVGVTAGASTPDWIVKEVIGRMEEIMANGGATGKGEQGENPTAQAVMAPEAQADGEPQTAAPAAGNGAQAEDAPAQQQADLSFKTPRPGETVTGTVVHVGSDQLLVDVGHKADGVVPANEISLLPGQTPEQVFSVGQEIRVVVLGVDKQEGHLRLSQRRAREREAWSVLEKAMAEGTVVEGTVVEAVKGGVIVDVGLRAFMPASHVDRGYVQDLNAYVGQRVGVHVVEMDKAKNRVIVSRKSVLNEELARKRQQTWAELAEGQVRTGVVKGLTEFGAFVDLGGVDGLLHISEMSWSRVNHPSEVVSVGDEIQVKVLRLDREREKISLGLKQVKANPWDTVAERYPVNGTVEGRVVRIAPFGAFVELEPGVEGLVHISQLANRHIADPREVVKEGDHVQVRVLRVLPEERRISLSMRPETPKPEPRQRAGRPAGERREEAAHADKSPGVTLGDVFGDLLQEHRDRFNGQNR